MWRFLLPHGHTFFVTLSLSLYFRYVYKVPITMKRSRTPAFGLEHVYSYTQTNDLLFLFCTLFMTLPHIATCTITLWLKCTFGCFFHLCIQYNRTHTHTRHCLTSSLFVCRLLRSYRLVNVKNSLKWDVYN